MRFLQAGNQKLVALEPELEIVEDLVSQAGFKCKLEEDERQLVLEIKPASTASTIRLFEAADPANREWFSDCQFYVNAFSGAVLQTPLTLANCQNSQGRLLPKLRVAISKELPAAFRLPGRQSVSEQVVYALLYNFLVALKESGVAICGRGGIQPLARGESTLVPK